ncbi:MAG: sialidase family protein [Phycisphaerales bacterium]
MTRFNQSRVLAVLLGAATIVTHAQAQPPTKGGGAEAPLVETARLPDGGIQPQAAVGEDGIIHLLYYKGDPRAGDLFYVTRAPAETTWSKAVRVNSQPGSAIAVGTDRGGQIALGRGGFVHVAWNGSHKATPSGPERSSPMLYSRLPPGASEFEPQRNLMTASTHLDGGGSVAADSKGSVYVIWHAAPVDAPEKDEAARRVLVAVSTDDGGQFAPEVARSRPANGACGCCGLKAAALPNGEVLVLYRSARETVHRDMHLMRSTDGAKTFTDERIDPWEVRTCPMSMAAIVPAKHGAALAWETMEDVRWSVGPATIEARSIPGKRERRRHPSIAADRDGRVIVAWTEAGGWNTPGKLGWSLLADGKVLRQSVGGDIPTWSLSAVVAKPNGAFLIVH